MPQELNEIVYAATPLPTHRVLEKHRWKNTLVQPFTLTSPMPSWQSSRLLNVVILSLHFLQMMHTGCKIVNQSRKNSDVRAHAVERLMQDLHNGRGDLRRVPHHTDP